MRTRSNVVAKAAEQVRLIRAENKRNDRLLDRIDFLDFRLRELLTTAEACEELHQHYKILLGVKADTTEP